MYLVIVVPDPLLLYFLSMCDLHLKQDQFRCGLDRPLHTFIFDSFSMMEFVLGINNANESLVIRKSIKAFHVYHSPSLLVSAA